MTAAEGHEGEGSARIVETASGTTSPDNRGSGRFAYAIAGAAVAVCLLMGGCVSGCMSLAGELVAKGDAGHGLDGLGQYERYLDDYLEGDGLGKGKGTSVLDLLGDSLGFLDVTVDSCVPASSYANAQEPVRNFVRQLTLADRDSSAELAGILRVAAWGDRDLDDALKAARTTTSETIETLRALQPPATEGTNASKVSRGLEVGKSRALDRWKEIEDLLDQLSEQEGPDANKLSSADERAGRMAQEAGEALVGALSASAER